MKTRFVACAVSICLSASFAQAEDWPGWRGPRGDGVSNERNIPVRWTSKDNVAWKTPIPGVGHSSPIVWGDRVFITTCLLKEEQRVLLCLDRRDGKIVWQRAVLTSKLEQKHKLNSFASATPATDGRHVYVSFLQYPDLQVACYDFDGKLVWRKSPGKFYSKHGFCSSPILYKDLVIINGDQDATAYLVALDKTTGAELLAHRSTQPDPIVLRALIVDAGGKKQLVLSGSLCVASYDPDSGKRHWLIDGPTEQFVASLVFTREVFFLTAGFPDFHNMGISPDGKVLWHENKVPARKASYVPSPIAHGDHFFLVSDLGYARCFEAKTGRAMWMEPLGHHHSASPVYAGGHLYFVADDGATHVLKAGSTFELVSRNPLGEECYSSPAIARGQIFIRTVRHLYCIGK